MTAEEIARRRDPRFQVFWRTWKRIPYPAWVQFPVYAPNSGMPWPRFQSRPWAAPFYFLRESLRGLRFRFWPAKGRKVLLEDLVAYHPPGRSVCTHCRGTGLDRSGRDGRLAIRFCPKMMAAFQAKAGFRVVNTRKGPRWLAGFEPERLVR